MRYVTVWTKNMESAPLILVNNTMLSISLGPRSSWILEGQSESWMLVTFTVAKDSYQNEMAKYSGAIHFHLITLHGYQKSVLGTLYHIYVLFIYVFLLITVVFKAI